MADWRGLLVHPEDLTRNFIDRMEKAGLDHLGLHPVGGSGAEHSLARAVEWLKTDQSLVQYAQEKGIGVAFEAHAMAYLLPRESFLSHPDWFRMNEKGERVPDVNLCPSNKDALDFVAGRAGQLAQALHTGNREFFFWMDDVTGGECHCPECRKYSASEQQLLVVKAMLRGIRRVIPGAMLSYIAYNDTMAVPRKVEMEEGVFLQYAPIRRDHHAPLFDSGNERNARETATLRDLIACFGRENTWVLDYWMDNSLFSGWVRPPKAFKLDESVMRRDVLDYQELGISHIESFGCFLGPDYDSQWGEADLNEYGTILK